MGAGNVKEAYVRWAHLPHAPFRLFVYMCVTAKDDDPRYWGGAEAMCLAMNLDVSTEDARTRSLRAVRKHVAALCDAKAIERTGVGAPGRNAEYTLRLTAEHRNSTDLRTPEPEVPTNTGTARTSVGRSRRRNTGTSGDPTPELLVTNVGTSGVPTPELLGPPEEEQDHSRTSKDEVVTAVDTAPASARKRSRARTREAWCDACNTDHSGLTCAEYRDGADLPPPKPHSRRRRANTSDPA